MMRIVKCKRAVAALEFAIIAPVLITLTIGMSEWSTIIRTKQQLKATTSEVAKMVAQSSQVNLTSLQNLCAGAQLVITAAPVTGLALDIQEVNLNNSGTPVLLWEGTHACSTTATIQGQTGLAQAVSMGLLIQPGDSTIQVTATTTVTPLFGFLPVASYNLTQTSYSRSRDNTMVATSCPGC
jgi:Flp pilus assembly protein TadG